MSGASVTRSVRFDDVVTIFYFKDDKDAKREDRLEMLIRQLQQLFEDQD